MQSDATHGHVSQTANSTGGVSAWARWVSGVGINRQRFDGAHLDKRGGRPRDRHAWAARGDLRRVHGVQAATTKSSAMAGPHQGAQECPIAPMMDFCA